MPHPKSTTRGAAGRSATTAKQPGWRRSIPERWRAQIREQKVSKSATAAADIPLWGGWPPAHGAVIPWAGGLSASGPATRIIGRAPEYIILASSRDRVRAKVFDLLKPKIDIALIANSVPNGRRPNVFLKLLIKLFGALERIAVGIDLTANTSVSLVGRPAIKNSIPGANSARRARYSFNVFRFSAGELNSTDSTRATFTASLPPKKYDHARRHGDAERAG